MMWPWSSRPPGYHFGIVLPGNATSKCKRAHCSADSSNIAATCLERTSKFQSTGSNLPGWFCEASITLFQFDCEEIAQERRRRSYQDPTKRYSQTQAEQHRQQRE